MLLGDIEPMESECGEVPPLSGILVERGDLVEQAQAAWLLRRVIARAVSRTVHLSLSVTPAVAQCRTDGIVQIELSVAIGEGTGEFEESLCRGMQFVRLRGRHVLRAVEL